MEQFVFWRAMVWMAALAVLMATLFRGGCLRRRSLDASPRRWMALSPRDVLVAFGLMLLAGPAVLSPILRVLGLVSDHDPCGLDLTAGQVALRNLLVQTILQLPVVIYIIVRLGPEPRVLRQFGVLPRRLAWELRAGLLGCLLAVPMVLALNGLVIEVGLLFDYQAPKVGHDMLLVMRRSNSTLATLALVASAVLVAPVLEEVIYRGLIQTAILMAVGHSRRWQLIIVASLLFALIHRGAVAWQMLPGLFVLAMVLGWLYERSGSLLPCVVVHAGFNAANTAMSLLPWDVLSPPN